MSPPLVVPDELPRCAGIVVTPLYLVRRSNKLELERVAVMFRHKLRGARTLGIARRPTPPVDDGGPIWAMQPP
jgi:hypothetical protein